MYIFGVFLCCPFTTVHECDSDINISQGSVATRLRSVAISDDHFVADLLLRLAVAQF